MARKIKPQVLNDREKLLECYAKAFSTGEGQVVLEDLRRLYANCIVHGPTGVDPWATVANEGGRRAIMYIVSMVEEGISGRGKSSGTSEASDLTDERSVFDTPSE